MSRQSKNARNREHALQFKRAEGKDHKITSTGKKGPAKTASAKPKRNAWWQKFQSYGSYMKGGKDRGGPRKEQVEEPRTTTAGASTAEAS